jgi:hypothetical protein
MKDLEKRVDKLETKEHTAALSEYIDYVVRYYDYENVYIVKEFRKKVLRPPGFTDNELVMTVMYERNWRGADTPEEQGDTNDPTLH